jgi:hypothetical protein
VYSIGRGILGVVYGSIYVFCCVGLSLFIWLGLDGWRSDNWISTLADVAGGSFGIALFVAILVEGFMLAWMIQKKIEDKAREEGREEGRQEGRQERDGQWEDWIRRRDEALIRGEAFDEPPPSRSGTAATPGPK